jgi:hypothetical protein
MYAAVLNGIVVEPILTTVEEIEKAKNRYKNYDFVEMTEENSPAIVGQRLRKNGVAI